MRAASLVIALAVGLGAAGCSNHGGSSADASRPLVVVLFDVSRSTQGPAIRQRYLSSFARVVNAVEAEHGTVVGDVIDDNPLACTARSSKLHDDALAGAEAILNTVPARSGTDIHDGLRLAERVFDAYPEATSRSLVMLSDMVEHSTEIQMGQTFDGTSDLDALSAHGSMAQLPGVQVYVVGAGAVTSPEL